MMARVNLRYCLTRLSIVIAILFVVYTVMTYFKNDPTIMELIDLTEEEMVVITNRKLIFFHETSNNITKGYVSLSPRRACSVESAAKHNPNSTIFLLYATLRKYEYNRIFIKKTDAMFESLLKYNNIQIRRARIRRYAKFTPLEKWIDSGKIERSQYVSPHFSDVMRYLTLWKFGGTYLDLDVIVMKNLNYLGENYAVAESTDFIAAGMLNFDMQGVGHYIINRCINEIRTNFKGNDWGYNGPGVMTRTLVDVCKTNNTTLMTKEKCDGFVVYPPKVVYPVWYRQWELYFNPNKIQEVLEMVKDSAGVHVWNNFSKKRMIDLKKPEVPYTRLARDNCPVVFNNLKDVF